MIKKTYTEIKVPCAFYLEHGSTLKHCKECTFFNGVEKDEDGKVTGVDCLRCDVGQINAHVTSFTKNGYLYKCREYNEKIDGRLSEAYNYCEKCCFDKTLDNGNNICLLRCGVREDDIVNFTCYEGEIWTEELYDADYSDCDEEDE